MRAFQLITALVFLTLSPTQENDWEFKKEKEGIRVYTRDRQESPLKEIKMTFELEANLTTIMSLLRDVEAFPEWIYKCSEARRLDSSSYYTMMDLPWPLSDRDAVSHTTYTQDAETKVIKTHNTALPDKVRRFDKMVRIEQMDVRWHITPIDKYRSEVVYTLQTDPGGNLPVWLINQVVDKGPVNSIIAFRKLLRREKYSKQQLKGIVNY